MGLLHEVVAAGRGDHLEVLHIVEHGKLTKGRTITPELVGVDGFRDVMLAQQLGEEGLSRPCVSMALKGNVQDNAVFINGLPQPVGDATNVHVHFIEVLPGTPSGFPMAQTLGEEVAELDAPGANGLARHADSSFQQKFFNIPVAQGKPVVELNGVPDDRERESIARKLLTAQHRATLPKQLVITARSHID